MAAEPYADLPDVCDLPDVEVIDVFVVDEAGSLVPLGSERDSDGDLPTLDLRALGDDVVRQLREFRAAPGVRPGVQLGTVVRAGHREEICQPVFVPPVAAHHIFLSDVLFADRSCLDVDVASRTISGDSVTWQATVRTGRFRRPRAAELCVHPSPSSNLTVLELIPDRPRRFRTKQFVGAGVEAVDNLGRRLSRIARSVAETGGDWAPV